MFRSELLKRLAAAYETIVEKQFKKLGYSVTRLDRQKERPRPDFLVSRSGRPQMLCEVKAIFSAGYRRERTFIFRRSMKTLAPSRCIEKTFA